jgi:serine/threonine protein kinase
LPRLELEYVPGGSLDSDIYHDLSSYENMHVLSQLSSALEYLHTRSPPIGHRDIKPENILVAKRDEIGIHVKFADFGLSRAADLLESFVGSLPYAAPEIYLKAADLKGTAKDTYGVAVDIWSLGVVIASLECDGLPFYRAEWSTDAYAWVRVVRDYVNDEYQRRKSELLYVVLENMLVIDPEERSSADFCHDEARRLLGCNSESNNDNNASSTPESLVVHADMDSASSTSEASTFRQNTSLDGLVPGISGTITELKSDTRHSPSVHNHHNDCTEPHERKKHEAQQSIDQHSKRRRCEDLTYKDHRLPLCSNPGSCLKSGRTTSARSSYHTKWENPHLQPFTKSEVLTAASIEPWALSQREHHNRITSQVDPKPHDLPLAEGESVSEQTAPAQVRYHMLRKGTSKRGFI